MWILPSRSRPKSLERFFTSCAETHTCSSGLVCIDYDDPDYEKYTHIPLPPKWSLRVGDRLPLGELINVVFEENHEEPWYGLIGDDMVPMTKHWDQILIEAAGFDGISFGNDGINGGTLCTHPVIGGDLARELGYIALPGLDRIYIDTALMHIGETRGVLRYMPGVITDHWHFSVGKSPNDETYRKPNADRDRAIYEAWKGKQ